MRIAIKVDVCTREGLARGVPPLLDLFHRLGLRASFFVSMGPDRSGLAVLQLLRPGFLKKLRRSGALDLYGWRTTFSGTLLPARKVGAGLPEILKRLRDEGHEAAVHGWDHRLWQDWLERLSPRTISRHLDLAFGEFERILGRPARAFGAPAWSADQRALEELDRRGLDHTSSTRRGIPFLPLLDGKKLVTLEVPVNLPCPEEILAVRPGADPYGDGDLAAREDRTNVYPAHAEVESHPRFLQSFTAWLKRRRAEGATFMTVGDVASEARKSGAIPERTIQRIEIPGRSGTVLSGWPEEC